MRRRIIGRAALLLAAASILVAQAPTLSLDGLMAQLAAVPSSRAHYRETKTLAALTRPIEDSGTLDYRRGGGGWLAMRSDVAGGRDLVVAGSTLTMGGDGAAPRTIDLDDRPQIAALVDGIRATLEGDLAQLRRSYDVALTGDDAAWRLTLTPRGASLARYLRQVTIAGSGSALASVDTVEANGDTTRLVITP